MPRSLFPSHVLQNENRNFLFLEWKLFSLLIQHWPCPSSVTMENPAMPAESIQGLHMSITEGVHKRYKTYQSHSLFAKTLPIHMMWLKPTNYSVRWIVCLRICALTNSQTIKPSNKFARVCFWICYVEPMWPLQYCLTFQNDFE